MAEASLVLVLALACLAGHAAGQAAAPAAADPCAAGLTFFPVNYENSNQPPGWTQTVQQQSGNTAADQLITIMLAGYPVPSLNIAPVSPFTRFAGTFPASCVTAGAAGNAMLGTPAAFRITWSLAGQGATLGPYTKGDRTDPPANITLGFVPALPDGNYCMDIKLDILAETGTASVGGATVRVPAATQSVTRRVCFIKLGTRPSANVTFASCNSSFATIITKIAPPPVFAGRTQMTSTVFHVYGKLRSTFTTTQATEGLVDYFDKYVTWSDPAQPNTLSVVLTGDDLNLIEGFYNVSIEGSMSTPYPSLVNLYGQDVYDDGSGTAKYMGIALRNASNKPIPIQTVKTEVANLMGPDGPVAAGQLMGFTWDTVGYGEVFCVVDGQRVSNMDDKLHCQPPVQVSVTDRKNHTLEVVMKDVCGSSITNGVIFNSTAWILNPKYQPVAPPPEVALPLAAPMTSQLARANSSLLAQPVTSAAGAAVPAGLAAAGAALLGFVAIMLA